MSKTICEHGYSGCHVCQNARLAAISAREQRRYEIARDVMAATRAAAWVSTRQTPDQPEVLASWAVADADALLAALETER